MKEQPKPATLNLKLIEPNIKKTNVETISDNFFRVINRLGSPQSFPNKAIHDMMVLFKDCVKNRKIKVAVSTGNSSVIQHLPEETGSSTLYLPYDLYGFMKRAPFDALSQIVYAVSELVLWEEDKRKGALGDQTHEAGWAHRGAAAYEAEFLLTLQALAQKKNAVIPLNDSQKFVLAMYPEGLKSMV